MKKQNGITLIALVITIIVLLILAGVSIATLTGQNGLLTRANNARTETEEGKEDELRRLTALEAATNINGTTHTDNSRNEEVQETVTIPAGFAVSQVEGENTIEDGLVIIDSNGNEFVWIPVDNVNNIAQCSTAGGTCKIELVETLKCTTHDNSQIVGKLYATKEGEEFIKNTPNITYTEGIGLREPDTVSDYDNEDAYLNIIKEILINDKSNYENINSFKETMQKDFNEMIRSIIQYHGFYIGRYEMSKSNNNTAQSKANSIALTSDNDNSNINKNGNTWYGLYAYGKTYSNSLNSVKSSMIWGCQYDNVMRWMSNNDNGIDVNNTNDNIKNTDSTYTGPKGDKDKIKNIYDLYGGKYEWTLEASNKGYRIVRSRIL